MPDPLVLEPPFRGRWLTQNSPAHRIPSHGTHLFGLTYAVDFVAVDARGRSAQPSWRSRLSVESPEHFTGFGQPILAPATGVVFSTLDGEDDHVARRSVIALLSYATTQQMRIRSGPAAIAGNHVVMSLGEGGPFLTIAHLRRGSVRVRAGDAVSVGDQVGECGNSGNSTEPHVHLHATDSADWSLARGLPISFRDYRLAGSSTLVTQGMPGEGEIIDVG
ncbi:M23 family metallopeptidase [Microbacterium caowuchunii]|uniref:M23 family metallopeptidase n=1 Tax=Microbacterium caowuchunii TaxID=2614638 RepID=UPI001243EEA3|nr:M23 family metallopeptidase [Microbacterium caowuchunii]QEV99097.1 M23 family metallopeptidase [Microbacterium caowuchunii]